MMKDKDILVFSNLKFINFHRGFLEPKESKGNELSLLRHKTTTSSELLFTFNI